MAVLKNYLSLIKFTHTIFAMPFAIIGFFLGVMQQAGSLNSETWYSKYGLVFVLVIGCMVSARSAAMAFNRWLDRNFDALNPRTAIREIPAGIISKDGALVFVIICCIVFILFCWFINPLCFALSPVALFVILFYSYTKRFTPLCHLILGLGLSLAPIGAYLAVTGKFALLPVLFSLSVIFWVSGFDIIYALQDVEFDRTYNLHSIPAWLGRSKALRLSAFLHVISASLVFSAGLLGGFGILYWAGVGVFLGMLIYQHSIVKADDLSRVNLAFMTSNGIASVIFGILVITDIFVKHL